MARMGVSRRRVCYVPVCIVVCCCPCREEDIATLLGVPACGSSPVPTVSSLLVPWYGMANIVATTMPENTHAHTECRREKLLVYMYTVMWAA